MLARYIIKLILTKNQTPMNVNSPTYENAGDLNHLKVFKSDEIVQVSVKLVVRAYVYGATRIVLTMTYHQICCPRICCPEITPHEFEAELRFAYQGYMITSVAYTALREWRNSLTWRWMTSESSMFIQGGRVPQSLKLWVCGSYDFPTRGTW